MGVQVDEGPAAHLSSTLVRPSDDPTDSSAPVDKLWESTRL
jgi:hypothetical protein